jgi:CheY-like chemotaxis protein
MAEEVKKEEVVKKKILLVDDDPDLLFVLSKTIESWGYEVAAVPSGREAISRIISNGFEIVILDYMMPELNGIATLREIRKINTKILAILFTVDLDSVPIKDTVGLDICTFIPKWYPEAMLKTAIDMAVKKIDGQ